MKDLILQLLPCLVNKPEDYINSIVKKYEVFINNSQIPSVCLGYNDISIIPSKLQKVYNNITTAFIDHYNFLINFESYENISYLIYLLLNKYFCDCINNDDILDQILYIDTKLMLEDYKRLMNYENSYNSIEPVHNLDILYKGIEQYPVVIWDKLMLINSSYDKDKLYDIISIRNRKGLGNFYITIGSRSELSSILGANLCKEIKSTLDLAFECISTTINVPRTKEVNIFK